MKRDALLLGSYPADTVEEVFLSLSDALGGCVKRLPDGEIGPREVWIGWQEHVLANHAQFERVLEDPTRRPEHRQTPGGLTIPPRYRLKEGVPAEEVRFGPLGYADEAVRSYEVFTRLKSQNRIPADLRFQISIPTSIAFLEHLIHLDSQPIVERAYEARLFEEVQDICKNLPPQELAVQWDVSKEMAIWEGVWPIFFEEPRQGIVERLARHCNAVPEPVELGIHLCYGDFGHRHWKEPEDMRSMVDVANGLAPRIERRWDWLHMPVPRDRNDNAYFEPLRDLNVESSTRVYLGLVHYTDGFEGTKARINTAEKYLPDFGVGTECGLGRRPRETILELLSIHILACES